MITFSASTAYRLAPTASRIAEIKVQAGNLVCATNMDGSGPECLLLTKAFSAAERLGVRRRSPRSRSLSNGKRRLRLPERSGAIVGLPKKAAMNLHSKRWRALASLLEIAAAERSESRHEGLSLSEFLRAVDSSRTPVR